MSSTRSDSCRALGRALEGASRRLAERCARRLVAMHAVNEDDRHAYTEILQFAFRSVEASRQFVLAFAGDTDGTRRLPTLCKVRTLLEDMSHYLRCAFSGDGLAAAMLFAELGVIGLWLDDAAFQSGGFRTLQAGPVTHRSTERRIRKCVAGWGVSPRAGRLLTRCMQELTSASLAGVEIHNRLRKTIRSVGNRPLAQAVTDQLCAALRLLWIVASAAWFIGGLSYHQADSRGAGAPCVPRGRSTATTASASARSPRMRPRRRQGRTGDGG